MSLPECGSGGGGSIDRFLGGRWGRGGGCYWREAGEASGHWSVWGHGQVQATLSTPDTAPGN